MKAYHIQAENDSKANVLREQTRGTVMQNGGKSWVSHSHGHGPAYLVVLLPEEVFADELFPDHAVKEVGDA